MCQLMQELPILQRIANSKQNSALDIFLLLMPVGNGGVKPFGNQFLRHFSTVGNGGEDALRRWNHQPGSVARLNFKGTQA